MWLCCLVLCFLQEMTRTGCSLGSAHRRGKTPGWSYRQWGACAGAQRSAGRQEGGAPLVLGRAFQESFPNIETTSDLYVVDEQRFTCCGGTATLDLALEIVASQHSADLACYIADACVHNILNRNARRQDSQMELRLSAADRRLYNAVKLMKNHIEEPLPLEHIAALAGTSVRQLQRLFRRYLSATPSEYYVQLRLWRARSLLLETDLSVTEVSIASGSSLIRTSRRDIVEFLKRHHPKNGRANTSGTGTRIRFALLDCPKL